MIIQITEEFIIGTSTSPDMESFRNEVEGIRKVLIDAIAAKVVGNGVVYAPCYHAVIDTGEMHYADLLAVEYFDSPSVDHSMIRMFKRTVKEAIREAMPEAEIRHCEGSAFDGSLLFFHELNDMIEEQRDAVLDNFPVIYDVKDLTDAALNSSVSPACDHYHYLLAESNLRCRTQKHGKDAMLDLDEKLGSLRYGMKRALMSALESGSGYHFFPGSFAVSYEDKHTLVARFFDVIGCPKGIASDSASRVIDEAYKEASRVLEEDGGEITHPVLSETDIIPDNPPSFFHRLMDRAEKYRDERLSLDESGLGLLHKSFLRIGSAHQ